MTQLNLRSAFLHVIDGHRWFAASARTWNIVGPHATGALKAETHKVLLNIDVTTLDSVLMRARLLIKFYRNVSQRDNDILLKDFTLSLSNALDSALNRFEHPIEVHLLHLTDWRDRQYRMLNAFGGNANRGRLDWNVETNVLVDTLFSALKYVSEQAEPWAKAFQELYAAAYQRSSDDLFPWPLFLSEWPDMDAHLASLGL